MASDWHRHTDGPQIVSVLICAEHTLQSSRESTRNGIRPNQFARSYKYHHLDFFYYQTICDDFNMRHIHFYMCGYSGESRFHRCSGVAIAFQHNRIQIHSVLWENVATDRVVRSAGILGCHAESIRPYNVLSFFFDSVGFEKSKWINTANMEGGAAYCKQNDGNGSEVTIWLCILINICHFNWNDDIYCSHCGETLIAIVTKCNFPHSVEWFRHLFISFTCGGPNNVRAK